MRFDQKLLFECKVLKQVLYKVKNQLGRSPQYQRMQLVYKSLKKFISGEYLPDFPEILLRAGNLILDPLLNRILTPVYSVFLSICGRIYSIIQTRPKHTTKILSKKLKKIILLQKSSKPKKPNFSALQSLLESIRTSL